MRDLRKPEFKPTSHYANIRAFLDLAKAHRSGLIPMPTTIAVADLLIDKESKRWRAWGRYGLVLTISAVLHFGAWQFRDVLEKRSEPKPKPDRVIEVILTPPPKPVMTAQAAEPAPKRQEAKKVEPQPKPVALPKPVTPPKPVVPPRPKAPPKPKPVALPRPDPKPEPPPVERAEPAEESPPAKAVQAPPEPVAPPAPTESPSASATHNGHAANAKREGATSGEGNSPAHYLQRPNPEYPAVAKRRNWEGRVVVRVKILADGSCGQAEIHQSSGHDVLDEAALEAVCKVRYAPNKRNGQPVEGWANVPINFNLEG